MFKWKFDDFFIHFDRGHKKIKGEKIFFSLKCIWKSNVIKKKNLGFSIWIYVFGFSGCNGLIKNVKSCKKILLPNVQVVMVNFMVEIHCFWLEYEKNGKKITNFFYEITSFSLFLYQFYCSFIFGPRQDRQSKSLPGPSRPVAKCWACPVIPLSWDNEGTSVSLTWGTRKSCLIGKPDWKPPYCQHQSYI